MHHCFPESYFAPTGIRTGPKNRSNRAGLGEFEAFRERIVEGDTDTA